MSDPRWGDDDAWARRSPYGSEPTAADYPLYPDPAYAGQHNVHNPYAGGYSPPGPDPTRQLPRQPPEQPPAPEPPRPSRPSRGLWLLTGAAVLLVVALVIAVLISNDSRTGQSGPATAAPTLTPSPRLPAPPAPPRPRTPSPSRSPAPTPGTTTEAPTPTAPGATSTVGYQVGGEGRAISIAYVGPGGVLRTEFSVTLPWSTEVALDSSVAKTAMVTIITAGNGATCTLTVDGAQVQQRSGAFVTICANAG
ncbi:hypothetical protein [Mycolicibacillus trivialis]|nr:hypothetical protein [Mycolicibacillus trivialis]